MRATRAAHLILLYLITLIVADEEYKFFSLIFGVHTERCSLQGIILLLLLLFFTDNRTVTKSAHNEFVKHDRNLRLTTFAA